jgi:hypothetical protein
MDPTFHGIAAANDAQYDVEVLCAGWNPLVTAVAEPVEGACGLIAGLPGGDIETFLVRFYQFQQG